jgi:hypothetical protein
MRRHLMVVMALLAALTALALLPSVAYAPPSGLKVEDYQLYSTMAGGVTQWRIDGTVRDDTASNYADLQVTMHWRYSSSAEIGWPITFPTDHHVVLAGDTASFTWWTVPPPGWSSFYFTVTGKPTTSGFLVLDAAPGAGFEDANGFRHYPIDVTNSHPFPVTALIAAGSETEGPTTGSAVFKDSMVDLTRFPLVLQSGEGTSVELIARVAKSPTPGMNLYPWIHVEAVRYAPLSVYRFYNLRTGTHFYTADPAERDTVINTLGWLYHLDGVAYAVNEGSPSNSSPLYRFYNMRTGTHFYTADLAEANNIIATMGSTYHFDGPAYNVSLSPDYAAPVWRFYDFRAGTHFYTADSLECDSIRFNLYHIYQYEGPAFNLAD